MCGGNQDHAMPAAVAVEILHNFTLVHDDIMDSAETRRGKKSVYKKWNKNTAILSGDLMFADAYQQLNFYGSDESFTKAEFADIHRVFLKTTVTVCEGQALDMEFVERKSVSRTEYLDMILGKTAALISGALEMGALTAHASTENRETLTQLGIELGMAFQIQDDLLDAMADPDKFGKKPGGDIFEGKKTYLTILALERANAEQAELIESVLQEHQPGDEQVNQVLGIFDTLKVLKHTAAEIENRYAKALNLLAIFPESHYKQELVNLINFLRNRDH